MTDDLHRDNSTAHAPIERAPADHLDEEAEGAKVPLRDDVWKREGADAPDAADIEDPETQL
jgi:hypothetical protein